MSPRSLTVEEIRSSLSYDPDTGWLRWKVKRSHNAEIGQIAGNAHSPTKNYRCWMVCLFGKKYRAHRIIWCIVKGEWPAHRIDHKNGDAMDNRWINLRPATDAENGRNTRLSSSNTSGFKGVVWNKKLKKWLAQIKSNGKTHYLGLYETPEEAHEVYCLAADMLFGEFANYGRVRPGMERATYTQRSAT